ncbi:hypothetical protein R6L23_01445 [Streptomyces sp. SR27]|uniref:hypothetical protein n=1 Tax=Streptomyces sp. SR27 TaxID=3076630 RepID=UPI00295A6FB9|nr:hypothetical protein [Streptomyces sp. SR27]MDV9186900.1 hypothetical protein [Streptomyces sp. SR27]
MRQEEQQASDEHQAAGPPVQSLAVGGDERAAGVAGVLDDLLDRGVVDAVLCKEFGRGLQQLLAGEFPALLTGVAS